MTEHFLKVSYPQPDCRPKYQCNCGAATKTRLRHMEHVAAIRLGEQTPYAERIGVATENLRRSLYTLQEQFAARVIWQTSNTNTTRWTWTNTDAARYATMAASNWRVAEERTQAWRA